jgi:hypothetical protein
MAVFGVVSLARLDFAGDAIVFSTGDDAAFHEIFRLGVWPVVDDAAGSVIIDAGEAHEIGSRRPIDIDSALLLDSLHHSLCNGLGIAGCGRSSASSLLADLVWTAIVRRAGGKSKNSER